MTATRAILGFREGLGTDAVAAQVAGLPESVTVVRTIPTLGLAVVRSSGSLPAVRAIARQRCDGLAFVERDTPVSVPTPVSRTPAEDAASDANGDSGGLYDKQPQLKAIGVPEAVEMVAAGVDRPYISRVAHADGGIDYTHPQLAPTYVAGRDFVADDERPEPGDRFPNHGVMTGSLFGSDPTTEKIAGVTPHAAALACQVYGRDLGGESGLTSHVADAIAWATEQGADVLLLVVQPREGSQAMERAVTNAADEGVFMAASSGNFGWDDRVAFPARYDGVMGVGATTADGERAGFSNVGPGLDIYAPGTGVTVVEPSGDGGRLVNAQGTSFSAPILAGVATLILAVDSGFTREDVARILRESADDGPGEYGIVNAKAAVEQAIGEAG